MLQDTAWLLKILRASKFSQLKSRQMVTNHLSLKNLIPEWLQDVDFTNPRIQAFFKTGYVILEAYRRLGAKGSYLPL